VTAAGIDFGFHEGLSATGRENALLTADRVERLIREDLGAGPLAPGSTSSSSRD
jgi:hypothetical protein